MCSCSFTHCGSLWLFCASECMGSSCFVSVHLCLLGCVFTNSLFPLILKQSPSFWTVFPLLKTTLHLFCCHFLVSVCLPVCLSICLCSNLIQEEKVFQPSVCLLFCFPLPDICLPVYLLIFLTAWFLCACLYVCLSVCLSVCLLVGLPVYLCPQALCNGSSLCLS